MSSISYFHKKSMEVTELAIIEKVRGNIDKSKDFFKEALNYELKAIESIESDQIIEPTYSVLLRSAGTLALDCGEIRKAEQIITKALSLDPPHEIAEELRDLLEKLNFKRHLELKGIVLDEDEMQMNMTGPGVGLGVINSDEFISRINNSSKLIFRIAERRKKLPFRERGRPKKEIKDDYEIFLSVPRAASFSVTFKLGRPGKQSSFPGILDIPSLIIDEFMDLIDLFNSANFAGIQEHISDPIYLQNFYGIARQLAPDGEVIRQVGFTSIRKGFERSTVITKSADQISIPEIKKQDIETEPIIIQGPFRFADATNEKKNSIKILDEITNSWKTIEVPEGMMSDIVKPMWNSVVKIKGRRKDNRIILEDIQEE